MAGARDLAHSPDALQRVGEVAFQQLGDPLAARDAFREAARRQWRLPFQALHFHSWGEAAQAAGLPDEAATALGQALARDPGDQDARLLRAQALASAGQRPQALQEARQVLERAPSDPRAAELIDRLSRS